MIKKLLLFIFIVVLLALIGAGVFIFTFDIDRYRQPLRLELEKAVGKPVELGKLSLRWGQTLSLQVDSIAILQDFPSREPLLRIASAEASVALMPLLQKQVRIESIVLTRPEIDLGRIQTQQDLHAAGSVGAPLAAGSEQGQAALPVELNIERFIVRDGRIVLPKAHPALREGIALRQVDCTVRTIRMGYPMEIEIAAAVGQAFQNLDARVLLELPQGQSQGNVRINSFTIRDLPIEFLLDRQFTGHAVEGAVNVELRAVLGALSEDWLPALESGGRIHIDRPRVRDVNIAKTLYDQLLGIPSAFIPQLEQNVYSRLPAEARAQLQARDTELDRVSFDFEQKGLGLSGLVFVIEHPLVDINVSGAGTVGQPLTLPAQIRFSQPLSAALIASVNELNALADAHGRLVIPASVFDRPPYAKLEEAAIVNRLVSGNAARWINRLIGGESQPATDAESAVQPGETTQAQPAKPPTERELMQNLLRGVLGGEATPQTQSQPQDAGQLTEPSEPVRESPATWFDLLQGVVNELDKKE